MVNSRSLQVRVDDKYMTKVSQREVVTGSAVSFVVRLGEHFKLQFSESDGV